MAKMKFREWYKSRYGVEYEEERHMELGGALRRMHESLADWADLIAEGKVPESQFPTPEHKDVRE